MTTRVGINGSCAKGVLAAAVAMALAGASGNAHAQDEAAAAEGGGLEEVVVTAQKREESIQDVPIAVTALTGDALEQQKIVDLRSLGNTIPNVQINSFANSPDSAVFTIRGVGVNDADPYV